MATRDDLFKNIKKNIIELPENKKEITYFLDKTILKSWLIDDKKDTCYVRIFMDLMYYAKAKFGDINVIVPVDVLMELKNEGITEVTKKAFKKWITCLTKIMIVDPDEDLLHPKSVKKIADVFHKANYKSCIITPDKDLYKDENDKGILVLTPHDIIITIVFYYSIAPTRFTNFIDEWIDKK